MGGSGGGRESGLRRRQGALGKKRGLLGMGMGQQKNEGRGWFMRKFISKKEHRIFVLLKELEKSRRRCDRGGEGRRGGCEVCGGEAIFRHERG